MITRPKLNLKQAYERVKTSLRRKAPQQITVWAVGDTTETTFYVGLGWKPINVFENGAIVKEGGADEYTITIDTMGGYSIVFNAAPAAVDIAIIAEKVE